MARLYAYIENAEGTKKTASSNSELIFRVNYGSAKDSNRCVALYVTFKKGDKVPTIRIDKEKEVLLDAFSSL